MFLRRPTKTVASEQDLAQLGRSLKCVFSESKEDSPVGVCVVHVRERTPLLIPESIKMVSDYC